VIRYTTSLGGIDEADLAGFWVGWPHPPSPALHRRILRGSQKVVLAWDDAEGRVVGFITAVGDGVLAASIPLLEVLPAYQGRGIGTELVRRMLAELAGRYMVDLTCDPELIPFYERAGLVRADAMILRRPGAVSG
jgi:ribosomal protein S18 acetylase RimI-like enzyme